MTIRLKRAYEQATPEDGTRLLVERLWPRGLSKERAAVDLWLKEVAPSPGLRRWFGHDPERWDEFRRRYRAELRKRPEELERLRRLVRSGPVTFVFAARDPDRNSAVLLRDFLEDDARRGDRS
jgi:uncharacterized protein YeaO (DUF488 family)